MLVYIYGIYRLIVVYLYPGVLTCKDQLLASRLGQGPGRSVGWTPGLCQGNLR